MAKTQSARKTKIKTKSRTKLASKKAKMPKRKPAAKKKTKRVAITTKKAAKKPTKKTVVKRPAMKAAPKPALKIVSRAAVVETPRISVGDMAPTFTLNDQNGQSVSLSDFQGKKVVLYFYPKDDTPGCTKEACSFRDNIGEFEGLETVILGVSFDDGQSHQKFISKYGLNFRLLSDTEKKTAKDYGCYVQKNMYGNISWGIERSTFVIDRNGVIAAAIRKVQVDGHTHEVLEVLKALG